jgi:hypothetical protein
MAEFTSIFIAELRKQTGIGAYIKDETPRHKLVIGIGPADVDELRINFLYPCRNDLLIGHAVLIFAEASGTRGEDEASLKRLVKQTKVLEKTAETAANHRDLAADYHQLARLQREESNMHAAQAAWYERFPIYTSSKFRASTVDHCRYFADKYRQDATKSEHLASRHERLASLNGDCAGLHDGA